MRQLGTVDSLVTAAMAKQVERSGRTVADLQYLIAAQDAVLRGDKKNWVVIQKLLRPLHNRLSDNTLPKRIMCLTGTQLQLLTSRQKK